MTEDISLSQSERSFLLQLYQQTSGDENRQIESADIGTTLGMDKLSSRKISEELIGYGFVAVKTLSGGIGITAEGLAKAQGLGALDQRTKPILGKTPVIDVKSCKKVGKALTDLKECLDQCRLDYDVMAQIVIDLKTLEVQLLSPKPKTAIVREGLISILDVLEPAGISECVNLIKGFIGPVT
jgi:hypothetical protein